MIGRPLKVRELIDEIDRGQVLLPEIQRSYVWKGPQVAKLIDSLYREYPAGQVLLWDPKDLELPVTRRLEGTSAPTLRSFGQPKIVLDGQQRLTSLYRALGQSNGIDVYFNLESEQFQLYLKRLTGDPHWVPVRAVVSGELHDIQILERIEAAGGPSLRDELARTYMDRLQKVRQIARYEFPIEIFESEDYEQVTELFVRVNSGGTKLREAELALAQLALRLPGALVDKFDKAMDTYADLDFDLDTRFLMRAMVAIGTGQSRFRYLTDFWKRSPDELEEVWRRARAASDAAVNFVRNNARFDSSDWIPSLNALIPLAVYFDTYSRVTPDVEVGLLRWFYVASARGRYSGSAETALDEDLRAVTTPEAIAELMRTALGGGRSLNIEPEEFDDAGQLNPLFSLTYALARKRGAKDWFKGIGIGTDVAGDAQRVQVHHIFPKKVLRDIPGVKRRDRDEIANLAFLAAKPNRIISASLPDKYLAEIADKHPERLEAQCIPMNRELWKLDRFQDFLSARRELLAASVNQMIADPS